MHSLDVIQLHVMINKPRRIRCFSKRFTMPDWTYQTLFKSPLAALGFDRGSTVALGSMGRLAAVPGGRWIIRLMGHMQPDERLAWQHNDIHFPAPVGLGCGLDVEALATRAFAEFGVGYIEVGPVVDDRSQTDSSASEVDFRAETIRRSSSKLLTVDQLAKKLKRHGALPLPVLARLLPTSASAATQMMEALAGYVDGFVVPARDVVALLGDLDGGRSDRLLIATVDRDCWGTESTRAELLELLQTGQLAGVSVVNGAPLMGKAGFDESVKLVADIRRVVGEEPLLIGAVGVHAPADALDYLEAGADLVQVDSGLAFAGPGLPKRINEAVLYQRFADSAEETPDRTVPQQSWFWAFLMGLGMFVGGLLAMGIALTRVVMPYDESLVGMVRGELMRINERLLPFMQHDRVTLAGTMLAIGTLYMSLAVCGIRRGAHWAYVAIVISATTGFFSFFTFLGFGYFDPFHAFVSAVLLQFLLLATILPQPTRRRIAMPDLWNDRRWRVHQWGQLALVAHGVALIVAGLVISYLGMTSVFVPEDLEFLQCTERVLLEANPMLVPLVAHDRATFGGMLIASGLVTLLAGLWSYRHGQAWLWWAVMIAGNLAYVATIAIHWSVGYNSLWHLVPAYSGFVLLWLGGLASYSFMVRPDARLQTEWQRRLQC